MNRTNLVHHISHDLGMSKVDTEAYIRHLNEIIVNTLKHGDKVVLTGFGTFIMSKRAARKGRNPKTGEVIILPEAKIPRFRVGKEFKVLVNKN